ncbi:MAG TPA: DNA polymerase IV [Candidatus Limnocylindrales bacterium]|nr:DNA polymerase IV [Candidatus Limnocylindrales bacterium]
MPTADRAEPRWLRSRTSGRNARRRCDDRRVTSPPSDRTILHVDLDAFFAAVEQRDRPELRGKPVIVGGGGPNQRGVVSAASYEARVFGVHSAMPLRTAGRLCPHGIFLPVDGRKYGKVSKEVLAILRRFTPLVEPISIDEAFMDVTGSRKLFGDGEAIARAVKAAVRDEVGLTISVGVARTKLVAKIASDLRKPDGLVVVAPGTEAEFLAPLPIGRLWGVGAKSAVALSEYGVRTIGDLAVLPEDLLERRFGKVGMYLGGRARGLDADPVGDREAAKSIGHEHTFDVDSSDPEVIERSLLGLSEGVAGRLRDSGVKASTVTVKIRDSSFRTITRQRTLNEPTDLTEPIFRTALDLARPEVRGKRIRLLGVTASGLGERDQLSLFASDDPRRRRAVEAEDRVRHRFGDRAITRARLVRSRLPAPFERDPMTPVDMREHARSEAPAPEGAPIEPGEEPDPPADDTEDMQVAPAE